MKSLRMTALAAILLTVTTTPEISSSTDTESGVKIEYLPNDNINTTFGTNHTFIIRDYLFVTSDRCILETPEGERIDLKNQERSEIFEVISHPEAPCAVNIIVNSEEAVGDWVLISEGTSFSKPTERILQITIHVEEQVEASVSEVTLSEGNDFYIRLKNPIADFDTCRLFAQNASREYEQDGRFLAECGYIVRQVTKADHGTWRIEHGNRTLYKAFVVLNVNGYSGDLDNSSSSLTWHRDDNINTTMGPEDAVYCRLENPTGKVVFDSFGRCRVVLDRVTMEHDGDWTMNVGVRGGVFTKDYRVTVRVVERAHDTPAMTQVIANKPIMTITCNVTSRFPLRSCKFRNPQGKILLAVEGVGQGRFTFHGSGSRLTDGLYTHECGFQITNPRVQDQGFWRCALQTEDAVHYGFLKAMSPWMMRDPEIVAAIVREPAAVASSVSSAAGARAALRCSVPAPLRYCYWRDARGAVFNVDPTSPHYEGGGFPSGECGLRFSSLQVSDSGAWSCHVGIHKDGSVEELQTTIDVSVYEPMVARMELFPGALLLWSRVHEGRPLEYCRYIRSDGLGITDVTGFPRYQDRSELSAGECGLWVSDPGPLERAAWTLVARPRGGEELASTARAATSPQGTPHYTLPALWLFIISTGILLVIISALVAPKKNRQWASERASAWRNSFSKKPPPANVNTACAA